MGYQHYMRGMSNGGSVFSRGEPLTNAELHARVPSIFATEAHESRSARFAPVPTVTVLDGLRAEGFEPFMAQQARTRVAGKAEFTKHMLRLRHRGIVNQAGEAFEVVLVNANDGTSAYMMIPGFYRAVCANGLLVGDTFEEVKVRHSGNAIQEVIEGAYRVLEDAPRVTDQVQRFKSIRLEDAEREILAEAAHSLRFPAAAEGKAAPINPPALLRPRRSEDRATDLFTVLNVLQENTLRGGMRGRVQTESGLIRRQSVREVAGIDQSRALNRALWMLTERMAELKAGA